MGGQLQCENWVKALQLTGQADKKTRRMNIRPVNTCILPYQSRTFQGFYFKTSYTREPQFLESSSHSTLYSSPCHGAMVHSNTILTDHYYYLYLVFFSVAQILVTNSNQ